MIVENAGFGAVAAAPIARRVFDYALLGQYPSEQDIVAVKKGQAGAPIGKPRNASEVAWPPGAAAAAVAKAAMAASVPAAAKTTPAASAAVARKAAPVTAVPAPSTIPVRADAR
jgi:penicillin-binding protein 2